METKYVILEKTFSAKEIQHFTNPKWHKKGVYEGAEEHRERRKLTEGGKKEKETKWRVGPFFRRKKSGKLSQVKEHERQRKEIIYQIEKVKKKSIPSKVYTSEKYSQKQLKELIPALVKSVNEVYKDLQKGRGPDKKKRKSRKVKVEFPWLRGPGVKVEGLNTSTAKRRPNREIKEQYRWK
jgi:hypothetical protein